MSLTSGDQTLQRKCSQFGNTMTFTVQRGTFWAKDLSHQAPQYPGSSGRADDPSHHAEQQHSVPQAHPGTHLI